MFETTRYPYMLDASDSDDDEGFAAGGDSDEEAVNHCGDSDDAVSYDGDSDSPSPPPEEPKRKKHRCCLSMVITALVLVIVLCGGILGGAYFAWDKFLGESTQMNLFDGLGVLSNIYKADAAVVTHPYDEEDLDDFYDNVLSALCMTVDDNYNLDIPQIVVDMLNSSGGEEQPSTEQALAALNGGVSPYAAAEEQAAAGEEQTTGSAVLDDLLNNLKFDWASLKEVTPKTGQVDLSGEQIAAFINEVLQTAFTSVDSVTQMQQEWNINFADVVELSQVSVTAGDEINKEDTCVSATIHISLRDAVKSVAGKFSGIAAFGIKAAAAILPKEIYFSASVYPCAQDGRAGVVINSTSAEDMDKMLRIVDGVLALTGSEMRSGDFMAQINATVYNAIQSVNGLIPINFVSDVINTQPIGAVISSMGLDLTPQEFFEIVRYVAAPDHYMADSNGDGQLDGFEYEEYDSNDLKAVLQNEYGVIMKSEADKDNPKVPGLYIDDSNLYASLVNLFDSTDEVIDSIDFASVAENGDVTASSTSVVTYSSIAALMRSYLASGDASGVIADYGFELLSFGDAELRENGSIYVTAKFKFDIRASLANSNPDLFDENGLFYNIINQLIPSAVYLTADIEISAATAGDMQTAIIFNDANYNTPELLNSMCRLLVSLGAGEELSNDLSYDSVCATLSDAISSVFAAKDEQGNPTGISTYVKGFNEDGLQLASVYSLLYSVAYADKLAEGAEASVTPEAFANAVKHIYLFEGSAADGSISAYNKVISESGYLGKNYRPDEENAFDLQTLIVKAVSVGGMTIDIRDVTLADVIISREHALATGGDQTGGSGEEGTGDSGEDQTGDASGEEEMDEGNSLAASLGLSADVRYGEHYWIEQIVMLGKASSAQEKAEEQAIFDSFKDKYNAWREANAMTAKTSPDELMVITATLASSALADNNAAFKLLPDYFTVTIIMDLSLTDEQREALKNADITDIFGDEEKGIEPDPALDGIYSVAVFINDMDVADFSALAGVLASNPDTSGLAQTVFGADLNNKVRRFLLSFALHENATEEGTVYDPIPDIAMYKVLACAEVLKTEEEGVELPADEGAVTQPAQEGQPVYDTAARDGLGKLSINVRDFAEACGINLTELLPGIPGLSELPGLLG